MDSIKNFPNHITEFPRGIDISGGKVHFNEDGKLEKITVLTATEVESSHHNQLSFTSLSLTNGIIASGLDEALGLGRQIEIIGIDGGIHTKGIIGSSYTQVDTSYNSYLIKIRLTTMYSTDTWSQANDWRITLNILSGNSIVGNFTVFMPPFTMMGYSTFELYVATDGTTYQTKTTTGFDRSLAGSSAVTEDMSFSVNSGSDVVISVADTTGFYEGNEVFVSDNENSEWARIKTIITNTSITVDILNNSYTTANNGKLDIIEYIQTIPTLPVQRGITKTKIFEPGIKSGIGAHFPVPFEADSTEDITVILRYVSTEDNPSDHVVKWCIQWVAYPMGEDIPETIQYGNLIRVDMIPPTTKMQHQEAICVIPANERDGSDTCAFQLVRVGCESGDTYIGGIKLVGVLMHTIHNKLGYES